MVSSIDVFDAQWRARLLGLNICEVGKVVSYDATDRTCTVAPSFLIGTRQGAQDRRTIEGVPVIFPVIGGLDAEYSLQADDDVLLIYTQRDVSDWWNDGMAGEPPTTQLFRTPVAIPVNRRGEKGDMRLTRGDVTIEMRDDDLSIRNDTVELEISQTGVTITGDLTVTGDFDASGDILGRSGVAWRSTAQAGDEYLIAR